MLDKEKMTLTAGVPLVDTDEMRRRFYPGVQFNNIVVEHKGHTISIAQHKLGSKVHAQEVMVCGLNGGINDNIISFSDEAKSLVEALTDALQLIDTMVQTKEAQDHG